MGLDQTYSNYADLLACHGFDFDIKNTFIRQL